MQIPTPTSTPCICSRPGLDRCTGPCTGYTTRSDCPPLIVLAVAAVAQTSISAS